MPGARLLVNYATSDLDTFEHVAQSAAALSPHYNVRVVVSHFPHPDRSQLIDSGDSYLQYAVNFPDLFRFAPPAAVAPFLDLTLVEQNVRPLAFQNLLGSDREGVLVRGAVPDEEDTFMLSPHLQEQLTRKRHIMTAHWQDTARLAPLAPAP